MYYHSFMLISGTKYLCSTNETEEYIVKNVVVPFVNGQVIESDNSYGKNLPILINMKSSVSLSIFKTEGKIDDDDFLSKVWERSKDYDQYDCTSEFIERVRELQAAPTTRSLLQIAFEPPKQEMFVIMKFGDKQLDSAYEGVIKPLANDFGLKVLRVDEIQDSGKISDQILENIASSRLIISDLSGERPNCYYETGFAHALGKDIILTIHKNSEIHFDLSAHRFIMWETESELRTALKDRLTSILGNKN